MRRTLIAGSVVVVLVAMTAGSFVAQRWFKKTLSRGQAAAGAQETAHRNKRAATFPTAPQPIVIVGSAMGKAFREGRLPAPLPQPQGSPEETAAELAKRVIGEDDQSTAALLTALQMSGFSVRGDSGTLALEAVKPGQGIMIDAWEAAATAKLFGDGMQIRLVDLSNSFAATIRPLKDAPVANLLVDGLRGAGQSDQPAMRFWADFIVELGRQSATPYDLLASDLDPGKVSLDAIQVSLILRRLVADMMVLQASKTHKAEFAPTWKPGSAYLQWKLVSYRLQGGAIRDAVWRPGDRPHLRLVQEEKGGSSSLPCTMTELQAQIMDITAYSSAKGFDKIIDLVKEDFEGAEAYGKAAGRINAILALIKLLAYYACMETDITMSGEPPLVRTQSTHDAGERRTLTGTVRENIGNWQALNCVRLALNGADLDISLPSDGPLAGVQTQWLLTSGGFGKIEGAYTPGIVEFVSPYGTANIQTATGPVSDFTAPKTDEEGHITIDIQGTKQPEKLTNPVPVMKQAEVRFSVSAKAVSLSQDLIDAGGVASGGPISMLVGGPVEMLLRSQMHLSKRLLIPVKDWESDDGNWRGHIDCTNTHSGDQGQNDLQTWSFSQDLRVSYDIRSGGGIAYGSAGLKSLAINKQKALRGGAIILIDDTSDTTEGNASDNAPATLQVDINEAQQTYSIKAGATFPMWPSRTHWASCIKGKCTNQDLPFGIGSCPTSLIVGKLDDPNHLHGSQSDVETGLGRGRNGTQTYTVTWDLERTGSN